MSQLRTILRTNSTAAAAIRTLARHAAYNSSRDRGRDLELLLAISIVLVEEQRAR